MTLRWRELLLVPALLAAGGAVHAQAAEAAAGPAASAAPPAPGAQAAATAPAATAPAATPAPAAPAKPAFDIVVHAPAPLEDFLARNLSLQRYRAVPDLEPVEFDRLLAVAEREVRQLLATRGYFTPTVRVHVDSAPRPPAVVVDVQPGEQAVVSSVDIGFEGDIATATAPVAEGQRQTVRRDWGLRPGTAFSQAEWTKAKNAAEQTLQAVRYPRAHVSYSLAEVDAQAGRVRLGLRLDSGPLFHLGPIQVLNAGRYSPLIAQRLAQLQLGRVYDREDLVRAQRRLTASGYYQSAFVFVDPHSDPGAAPVQVDVREAPVHRWTLGLGLTSDLGPHASIDYRNNLFPTPFWRTDVRLRADRKAPLAEVETLAVPGENGWRWGTLASVSQLEESGQRTRTLQLRLGRSRAGDHIRRNAYVEFDRASVRDTTGTVPPADKGEGSAIFANYVVGWLYFDHPDLPKRGWGVEAQVGAGVTLTNPQQPFQRTVLRWKQFIPLSSSRLQLRAEGGAVLAPDEANIPAPQLFRLGGDTSVRGYAYNSIGANGPEGVNVPGRYMALGSVEWQRPIRRHGEPTNLEHIVYLDSGAVANRPGALHPVFGLGTGARYLSPIGPLSVSVAYGFATHRLRLHLSVGVTF